LKIDLAVTEMYPVYELDPVTDQTDPKDIVDVPKRLYNHYTKALAEFARRRQEMADYLLKEGTE
jgi:hypothetical protein